jgi:hypothetical protein
VPHKGVSHRSDHVHTEVVVFSDAGREPFSDKDARDNDKAFAHVPQALPGYAAIACGDAQNVARNERRKHRKMAKRRFGLALFASRAQLVVQTRHPRGGYVPDSAQAWPCAPAT